MLSSNVPATSLPFNLFPTVRDEMYSHSKFALINVFLPSNLVTSSVYSLDAPAEYVFERTTASTVCSESTSRLEYFS